MERDHADAGSGGQGPKWIAAAEDHERRGQKTDADRDGVMIRGSHHRNATGQNQPQSDCPVEAIDLRYSSPATFTAVFKQLMGDTPDVYRRKRLDRMG